jgi:hypothetical protein
MEVVSEEQTVRQRRQTLSASEKPAAVSAVRHYVKHMKLGSTRPKDIKLNTACLHSARISPSLIFQLRDSRGINFSAIRLTEPSVNYRRLSPCK